MYRKILERNRKWEEGIIRTEECCMNIHIRVPNDDSMMLARYEKERGVLQPECKGNDNDVNMGKSSARIYIYMDPVVEGLRFTAITDLLWKTARGGLHASQSTSSTFEIVSSIVIEGNTQCFRENLRMKGCMLVPRKLKKIMQKKTELVKYRGKESCRKEKRSKIKCQTKWWLFSTKLLFSISIFLANIFLTLSEISSVSGVAEDFSGCVDIFCVTLGVRKEKTTYAINKQ